MPQNERTQPNDDKMPVDKPGDNPAKQAPVKEPKSRGDVPERDPKSNEPEQQAPTDPDIERHGHVQFGSDFSPNGSAETPIYEPQATVDAANGQAPVTPVGP